jgi:hypothetical protein
VPFFDAPACRLSFREGCLLVAFPPPSKAKQRFHLFIRGLCEISVVLTNGLEGLWGELTNQLIDKRA